MKRVAITSFVEKDKHMLNMAYTRAFADHNILPMIVPSIYIEDNELMSTARRKMKQFAQRVSDSVDALVLSGGADINPTSFGKQNKQSFWCNRMRDGMEQELVTQFMLDGKPILGICRGFQMLGLMLGFNNFIQDLKKVGEMHLGKEADDKVIGQRDEPVHEVTLFGKYREFVGVDRMNTNSWHHQGFSILQGARRSTNRNLERNVVAYGNRHDVEVIAATNRIVEGFSHMRMPIVGFQNHPEEYKDSVSIRYFVSQYLK